MGKMRGESEGPRGARGPLRLDISVQFETSKFSRWNVARHLAKYLARLGLIILATI